MAVAANLCAAAVGTETDGSIICPSHITMMAQEKGALTDEKYLQALATNHRLARDEGIDATYPLLKVGATGWGADPLKAGS